MRIIAVVIGLWAWSGQVLSTASAPGAAPAETAHRVEFRREVVNLEDVSALLAQAPPPSLRRGPGVQGDLWYGEILRSLPADGPGSREHNVPFAVLFEGGNVVRAWSDSNLNGDLSDDPAVKLSLYPASGPARSFLTELHWSTGRGGKEVSVDRLTRVVVPPVDPAGPARRYRVQEVYGMLGTVELDGVARLALLYDANHDGFYDRGNSDGIFFDLDGDRHFSIDVMSDEFGPFAIPFSLDRWTYSVDEVDPGGTALLLHQLGPARPEPPPQIGKPVPDFEYSDVNGRSVRLSAYRDRPVVVYFWSSWCGACRHQATDLRRLYERLRASGLEILGISYDTDRHAMERFRELNGQPWPTSFTGGFPAQDPVGRLFHEPDSGVFYLVAPDGRLAAKLFGVGALEEQLSKLTAASQARTGTRPSADRKSTARRVGARTPAE